MLLLPFCLVAVLLLLIVLYEVDGAMPPVYPNKKAGKKPKKRGKKGKGGKNGCVTYEGEIQFEQTFTSPSIPGNSITSVIKNTTFDFISSGSFHCTLTSYEYDDYYGYDMSQICTFGFNTYGEDFEGSLTTQAFLDDFYSTAEFGITSGTGDLCGVDGSVYFGEKYESITLCKK